MPEAKDYAFDIADIKITIHGPSSKNINLDSAAYEESQEDEEDKDVEWDQEPTTQTIAGGKPNTKRLSGKSTDIEYFDVSEQQDQVCEAVPFPRIKRVRNSDRIKY